MSFLSDRNIEVEQTINDIFEPYNPDNIQPASYDLTLSNEFMFFPTESRTGYNDIIDPETFNSDRFMTKINSDRFILNPHEFVLSSTEEQVNIPRNLVGQLNGRSSLARLGLIIHTTAGFIDPGYKGNITLELLNFSPRAIILRRGMRIGQLVLAYLASASTNPYGPNRGSKYQDSEGVVGSRINEDREFHAST